MTAPPTDQGVAAPAPAVLTEPRHARLIAFALYALLAFLYFGVGILIEPGRQYVGVFDDPQIPIWSFAWWLHALEHGQNPFVTHGVWAPTGLNLAWVNTVPALAVAFAPLTALFGPVASYDVAAAALPALAAWTGFLLCRHLVGQFWPALLGGYLFGFSSYELGHVLGQPQLTAVFALPLIALVVVRGIEGELSGRAFVWRLGLLVALQIYLSSEIALTATISLVLALVLGFALAPASRTAIRRLLGPLAGGYALGALLAAPVLYYSVSDLRVSGFTPPSDYTADLLNLVIPTHLEAVGAGWAHSIARHFPGNSTEQGAFVGVPLLAIVALYARRSWRTPRGRFLLAALALATYLSLGPKLTVAGHGTVPLPTPLGHQTITLPGLGTRFMPLLDNVLAVRFALYAALASAVIAAIWTATARPGILRWLLPGLTVLLLVPNPGAGVWATTFSVPKLFTSSAYRPCLDGATVLPEPVGAGGQAMLWQAAADFRFALAGGRLQTSPPSEFLHPEGIAQIAVGYPPVRNQSQLLREYVRAKGVTDAVVDEGTRSTWAPALDRITAPREIGGALLYRFAGSPSC